MSDRQAQKVQLVVGTEVHLQLKTRTKLFCGCRNEFHAEPNTLICPVCLGEPGALPRLNKEAYRLALIAGESLGCEIQTTTRFDRKNYFYPDLPKGYQITQFFYPFAKNGELSISTESGSKSIRIERIHIEEDSGKLTHQDELAESWVDFNRAGIALIEIVSKPDIESRDEAYTYLTELRLLLRHLGVSDCEMQEGSLRVDLNVNVHITTSDGQIATPIVEVKNLNSFSSVKSCIDYELERQVEAWQKDNVTIDNAPKETRGWNDEKSETVPQRIKEGLADYRYFPEPDLPPFIISKDLLASLPKIEHPRDLQARLVETLGVEEDKVKKLIRSGRDMVEAYEYLVSESHHPETTINWLINETFEAMNEKHCRLEDLKIGMKEIGELIDLISKKAIALRVARKIFKTMLEEGLSANDVMQRDGMVQIDNQDELKDHCLRAIENNPKAVEDYNSGKKAALNGLMGRVMQQTKGKANPQTIRTMLQELLGE